MKAPVGVARLGGALTLALVVAGCHPHHGGSRPVVPAARPLSFTGARVRAFSDSLAITAIADSPSGLLAGTSHGLIRWDGMHPTVLTQRDGLPADRIVALAVEAGGDEWLATAKGLWRGPHNASTVAAAPPVGSYLTGIVADGKTVWAGGPEGLARLRAGRWERYFPDTGVTALATGPGGTLWVGTSDAGVLRIRRGGDKLERFGPAQGCEVEVVRGMVAVAGTLLVVGEGAGDAGGAGRARAAFYDGHRFYAYELSSASLVEWAARAGARTIVGTADRIYSIAAGDDVTTPAGAGVHLGRIGGYAIAPSTLALKADLPSAALEDLRSAVAPRPTVAAIKNGVVPPPPTGPSLAATELPLRLPDGVTTVAGSERGLLVGTRFLGAMRIENDVPRLYRLNDLVAGAARLTVACIDSQRADECFLATGGTRAWRFDGQAFDPTAVDPEPGSRVLAVLRDPHGDVLAIHRGADDRQLRVSRVANGRWTPVGIQAVQVPNGAPDLDFAGFAPDGHLWVGLRYTDNDGDARDWGANEIAVDSGKVIAHKELPTDVVAMYWKAANEAWFATRSGAARLLDGKVRVFTENDGMASDITRDIVPGGTSGEIFVATGRGTGRFDGTRWTFPRLGAFYQPANALASDSHGNVFIGTDKGLFCVGECAPDAIDISRGLNDEHVKDLAVDARNRVWVLTEKGINIVEP